MRTVDDFDVSSHAETKLLVGENLCHRYCIDMALNWYESLCADSRWFFDESIVLGILRKDIDKVSRSYEFECVELSDFVVGSAFLEFH